MVLNKLYLYSFLLYSIKCHVSVQPELRVNHLLFIIYLFFGGGGGGGV